MELSLKLGIEHITGAIRIDRGGQFGGSLVFLGFLTPSFLENGQPGKHISSHGKYVRHVFIPQNMIP
jgi:hypothetical protein